MTQFLNIPYSWEAMDYTPKFEDEITGETRWGSRKYRIFIWGHDQYNDHVCWIIEDYMPHLYVKIEDKIENEEETAPFILDALNKNLMSYVIETSKRKTYLNSLKKLPRIIEGYIPEERRPMFYYNEDKHKVYKVFFALETCMDLCYEYLENRQIKLQNGVMITAKAY